jgi:hypothetical protein
MPTRRVEARLLARRGLDALDLLDTGGLDAPLGPIR